VEGAAVGYLLAVYVFSLEHLGLTAEIDELFVLPSQRGRGVGAELLRCAEAEFLRAGCTNVSLQLSRGNDAARAFYHRHGYSERSAYELLDRMLHEPTPDPSPVRGDQNAIALFEQASAKDSIGLEQEAAVLYRQALAGGLTGGRRRRAVIQLASTLRNLGQAEESVALLRAEREAGSDDLDDAVAAFLALALIDTGREREAAALALAALSRHLTRYNRSLEHYAKELCDQSVKRQERQA
jgi:hypothetical protein